ncbi:MAG: polyprenyl synthetase family protein [Chthoniobacterales bacterium]
MESLTKSTERSQYEIASEGFRQAFDLIEPALKRVEARIAAQANSFDPAVEGYIAYACGSAGKRLRPALALLAGGATGGITSAHEDLAVIIELIHIATLVHDDIIDGADLRRDQPTANAKWGSTMSVLLGDCLFAHALRLAAGFDDSTICRRIADAAADVCSGEIIQTQRRFDLKLNVQEYLRIIEMKTAALFSVACELGSTLGGNSPETTQRLRRFGSRFGIAYQIYDDCLDLIGDENRVGKTLGTDFLKGKFTLPIIAMLDRATDKDRTKISEWVLNHQVEDFSSLREFILREGGVNIAITAARGYLADAVNEISGLPETEFQSGLGNICQYVDALLDQINSSSA